jgi:hypothetical protein
MSHDDLFEGSAFNSDISGRACAFAISRKRRNQPNSIDANRAIT